MPRARVYGGVKNDMTPPGKILRPVTALFSRIYTRGPPLGYSEDLKSKRFGPAEPNLLVLEIVLAGQREQNGGKKT